MFGNEYDIVREFNNYFLDYHEQYDPQNRWTDRLFRLRVTRTEMFTISMSECITSSNRI